MKIIGLIITIAILLILTLCQTASADPWCGGVPLTTEKEGIVSGDLWFDHSGPMIIDWTKDYTLPLYTDVDSAYLYVAVYCGHMKSNRQGRVNITFNDELLGGTPDGLSSEVLNVSYSFPGEGGTGPAWVNDHCVRVTSDYLMWYNVTDLVESDSDVWVKTWRKEGYTGSFDGRIKAVTLVVAYDDGDSDTVYYWLNQGHDTDNYYWDSHGPNYIGITNITADLPGSEIQHANLSVVHMASSDGIYTFNGDSLPSDPGSTTTPPGENAQFGYTGFNTWYVPDMINANGNNTLTYDRTGGYYKITMAYLSCSIEAGGPSNLSEGFETDVPPAGWTEEIVNDPGTDPDWSQESTGYNPSCSPPQGSYMAKFNSYSCPSDASARLYTPALDFSSLTDIELTFRMYHDSGYSTKDDRITVQGSTDGSSWTDLATINRYDTTNGWQEHSVDLSSYSGESSVYIGLFGISDYGHNIYIDEVEIDTPTPKTLNSLTVNQASTDPVTPGSDDEMILRLDFEVEGSLDTLLLNSIEVESGNTDDADVSAVKLYRTDTTTFSTDNPLGTPQSFSGSSVNFNSLEYDLPEGMTYVWVVYDVASSAAAGNILDAKILTDKINVAGSTYPSSDQDPAGDREITQFIEIGDSTDSQYYVPFNGNYDYGWSKIIYTKADIGSPITINKIAFNVSKTPPYSYTVNDQRIYMMLTADASFTDGTKPDPSTMTQVYSGSITWESGWTIISLDTPFSYNNVDNLLVYYENRDGTCESDQPIWCRTLTLPDYRSGYDHNDGSFPTGEGSLVRFIPNIQLYYSQMATGLAVSKTVYDPVADEWVDSINGAIPGDTYRFKIDVTASGCDLTDVVINDILSPGLSYAGNPSPSPPVVIGDMYQWTFPTLNESETKTIEFDATVNYHGNDCNLANATGWCNITVPEQFSDEDSACIDSRVDLAVKSDWNEHIKVNPGCPDLDYYRIIVNESNTVRVWVINNGPGNITSGESFDVCFDLNGVNIACETLTGPLNTGEDVYFDIDMMPDCTPAQQWPGYPPMPGYPCGCITSGYRLNVTVDAGSIINETDEDNNLGWRAVSVCCNGYKSKNFDCDTADDPLTLFEYDEFYGGVVYNVSGVEVNLGLTPYADTRIHHIDIPSGMNVAKARLYVYWYDWTGPSGELANLNVDFEGTTLTAPDASYTDQKCLNGAFDYPRGTYVYDVSSLISGSGDYMAIVTNLDESATQTMLLGEMLVVVYDDPTLAEENHIQLWMMEGDDLLMGRSSYCITPQEATATAEFTGTISSGPDNAELITVVANGMELGNNLLFNGNIIRTNAWDASSEAYPGSKINIEVDDVTGDLISNGNTVGFQDNDTMGMDACNAILVVKCEEGDLTPPYTDGHDPAPGAVNVAVNTNITVHVKDSGVGVNESSIVMKVNGVSVTPVITGTSADFELVCDPLVNFGYEETVNVSIDVCDLNDNCMQYTWEFTTEQQSQPGVCGDVTNDDNVNIGDVILLANHVGYPDDPRYEVDEWAADVNGNGGVNIGDVILLANHVGYPDDPRYSLNCS